MTPMNASIVALIEKHPLTTVQIAARLGLTAQSVRSRLYELRLVRPDIVIGKDGYGVPTYFIPKGGPS